MMMMGRITRETVVKSSFVLFTGSLPPSTGLPLHVNELKDIEPQLMSLVVLYKIDAVSLLFCHALSFFCTRFLMLSCGLVSEIIFRQYQINNFYAVDVVVLYFKVLSCFLFQSFVLIVVRVINGVQYLFSLLWFIMIAGCYEHESVSGWNGTLFQSHTAVSDGLPAPGTFEHLQNLRLSGCLC